ncbi:uncharacterized protein LOC125048157 [Penaeus chinensis]|uniref:uncharacterized protein LOC125048157 n=1 Tax=Penaeus chinensis TaxID=139456 RepID=UPI001FB67CD0|nr:uncharacterized protein LOC125048157 [Penaeus chinensis]XP_047502669.1 uncharacterized protein LOC125048157 [Penaeus chinensis]
MKIALAVVLGLVCLQSGWSWMADLDANREPQRRLCGWKLANKLNSVCKGVYNKPGPMSNSLYYRHRRGKTRPRVGGFAASLPQARESFPFPPEAYPPNLEAYPPNLEAYPPNPEAYPPSTPPGQDPRTRPSATDAFDRILLHNALLSSGVPFPFLTEAEASQVLQEAPRRKRGLSAECCRKACSVSELVDYCY